MVAASTCQPSKPHHHMALLYEIPQDRERNGTLPYQAELLPNHLDNFMLSITLIESHNVLRLPRTSEAEGCECATTRETFILQ